MCQPLVAHAKPSAPPIRRPAARLEPSEQVISPILSWDEYLVLADYRSYIDCHDRAVGPAWADQDRWTQVSILNTARSGFFSSDRTVSDYNRDIWHVEPVSVPPYPASHQVPQPDS